MDAYGPRERSGVAESVSTKLKGLTRPNPSEASAVFVPCLLDMSQRHP